MGKWIDLPKEIHSVILGYLPISDLKQCQVVNKKWLPLAHTYLYEEVNVVYKTNGDNTVITSILGSRYMPAELVKTITIKEADIDDGGLNNFLKNCPNVTSLKIKSDVINEVTQADKIISLPSVYKSANDDF
jgi:hypothetical protein